MTSSVPEGRSGLAMVLWTSDLALATEADAAGIDRIGCDLEREGKLERQRGWGTWVSDHNIEDLRKVRGVLSRARLFVRPDPFDGRHRAQLDAVLSEGTRVVMLPVAEAPEAIAAAADVIAGRAVLTALVETKRGVDAIEEIVDVAGLDEVMLGPNDLSASLGLANRFAAMVCEEAERVAAAAHSSGVRFGLGGLAAAGDARVAVAPELVFAQHARLGSTSTIISRVFVTAPGPLAAKVARARDEVAALRRAAPEDLELARKQLAARAQELGRI
jgi:hypothetical protein